MEAYIYKADIYCEDCGEKIRGELSREGKRPADIDDEYTYDSDDYPKGPFSDGGGEADCPQHCGGCGIWLENPLTPDGVDYVIEALNELVDDGRGSREVSEVWARDLADYTGFDPSQENERSEALAKFWAYCKGWDDAVAAAAEALGVEKT